MDKRQQSSSQKLASQQQQRIATECLPRIDLALQEIHSTNNICVQLNSKRQTAEAKTIETREQLKKFNEELVNIQDRIESLNKMLTDMKILTDEVKSKSVTGPSLMDADNTYTLKVNLSPLLNDDSLTVHSDPFQSSQWGYKIKISVTTQTDGQTKQRFLLVSFVILRGDYDSILRWYFCYPVKLCLVDLTGAHKHVTHSIRPDSRTAIFGEPLNNANTPYQITHFYPIDKLREKGSDYVRDDNIFIRIHIDFMETGVHPF